MKCPSCEETLFKKAVESNLWVCPKCQHHMRISARQRVEQLLDPGTFESFDDGLIAVDPLKFVDSKPYPARIADTQKKTGERDALLSGFGFVKGRRVVVAVMDFTFLGGSMGSVVGEKITRAIGYDADEDYRVRDEFGDPWEAKRLTPLYPLFAAGIDRNGCERLIRKEGLPVPRKSACTFCPSNTLAEWAYLRARHPARFADAVAMSRNAQIDSPDVVGLMRCLPAGKRQLHLHVWNDDATACVREERVSVDCECAL